MNMPLANRLVLIPDHRRGPAPVSLRRYRLARLDLRDAPAPPGERFSHLKRIYD